MASYKAPDGHGPAPNMPPSVIRAAKLPPKVTDTHVFFFGYEGSEPANTFQQWYPSPFKDEADTMANAGGAKFLTAEHYMMYHKALLMHDAATAKKILSAPTPAEAKSLGREVKNFDQKAWDEKCDKIVERGNWLKFTQDDKCRSALLGTGDRKIIEASPSDKIWGIGFAADEAEGKESEWGANKLGKALERVRDRLRQEQDGASSSFLQLNG